MIQDVINPLDLNSVHPDSVSAYKEELAMLKNMPFDEFMDTVVNLLVQFVIHVAIAVVVFYVGKFVIKRINSVLTAIFVRRKADRSLATFVLSLVRMVLYFLLIIIVIGIVGIETSSFVALFASAGVAIGMALSGTLQNFAGGVLILLIKPYKVGDYIEAQGFAGTVKEIQIFHTIITTPDNKSIIIPNGGLSTGSINNYSREDYRRVDWSIGISYGDDVEAARSAILAIFADDSRVVKKYVEDDRAERAIHDGKDAGEDDSDGDADEPKKRSVWDKLFHRHAAPINSKIQDWQMSQKMKVLEMLPKVDRTPVVWVSALADNSVNLTARAWTRNEFYWSLYFDLNERFYKELPKAGINFPFPQLDVHLPSDFVDGTAKDVEGATNRNQ